MKQSWILLIIFILISVQTISISSYVQWRENDIVTSLIVDVIESVLRKDDVKCIVMVDEGKSYGAHHKSTCELDESVGLTLFEENNTRGQSLALSGKYRNFHVMLFKSIEKALQFFKENLAYLRY